TLKLEGPTRDGGRQVMPPPVPAQKRPEPVADATPPEMPEAKSAADRAADESLRRRLAEMERAESLQRERQQQQPPQRASEPQQQQPETPAHVQEWLSRHPQYTDPNDEIAQLEIYAATRKCARDAKTQEDPDYLEHIERHLGLRPQANGNDVPKQNINAPPMPRYEAPPREPVRAAPRQQYSAP